MISHKVDSRKKSRQIRFSIIIKHARLIEKSDEKGARINEPRQGALKPLKAGRRERVRTVAGVARRNIPSPTARVSKESDNDAR